MCTCCKNSAMTWAMPASGGCGCCASQSSVSSTGNCGYGGCFGSCSSQSPVASSTQTSSAQTSGVYGCGGVYYVQKINGCCNCPYAQSCRRSCGWGYSC